MKKFKNLLIGILTYLLISNVSLGAVFAQTINPTSDSGKHYKITESHKQITDNNELIKLAIQQRKKDDKNKSFNSKQVIEKREYDNGTIEEDCVSSSLCMLDKDAKQIDASKISMSPLSTAAYTYTDTSYLGSNAVGSVVFQQTLYVTMRYSNPLLTDLVYRVNGMDTKIVAQYSTNYATQIQQGLQIIADLQNLSYYSPIQYNPSLNVSYHYSSPNSNFYLKDGGYNNRISSYYKVTINTGAYIDGGITVTAN